jgi:hypothetical protein
MSDSFISRGGSIYERGLSGGSSFEPTEIEPVPSGGSESITDPEESAGASATESTPSESSGGASGSEPAPTAKITTPTITSKRKRRDRDREANEDESEELLIIAEGSVEKVFSGAVATPESILGQSVETFEQVEFSESIVKETDTDTSVDVVEVQGDLDETGRLLQDDLSKTDLL